MTTSLNSTTITNNHIKMQMPRLKFNNWGILLKRCYKLYTKIVEYSKKIFFWTYNKCRCGVIEMDYLNLSMTNVIPTAQPSRKGKVDACCDLAQSNKLNALEQDTVEFTKDSTREIH